MKNNRNDPFNFATTAKLAFETDRLLAKHAAERGGHDTAEGLSSDSAFVPRANVDMWVASAFENGRALGFSQALDCMLTALATKGSNQKFAHLAQLASIDTTTPTYRARVKEFSAVAELWGSAALAKFEPEKRASIALAWSREENGEQPKERKVDQDSNPMALKIVNAGRKARNLPALERLETDESDNTDTPAAPEDTTDEWEPDPTKPGQFRRKCKPGAADDEPQDHQDTPNSKAALAFAFAVANADQKRRGKKALTRDEFLVLQTKSWPTQTGAVFPRADS